MEGWPWLKIGDLCEVHTGGTPSRSKAEYFEGGDIRWLVSGDIHKKEIHDCEGRITEAGLNKSNAKLLPLNSVMIALNGQGKTRGTVALLRCEATCNQSLIGISPRDSTQLMPEFLYCYLDGAYGKIRRITGDDGNDRRGLNMTLVRNIEVPLPPLPEQERIVAILDEAFAAIATATANAEKNLANARELFESQLEQAFSGDAVIEEWANLKLGEVLKLEYGKPLPKERRSDNGAFPAYGANGIKCRTNDVYWKKSSIVVGRKGSAGEINLADGGFWPLDVTYFVVFDEDEYDLRFLYYLLSRLNLPSLAKGVKPGINRNDVYAIEQHFPPLPEQERIVAILDKASANSATLTQIGEQKLAHLANLKQSLLHKAFTGELTADSKAGDRSLSEANV